MEPTNLKQYDLELTPVSVDFRRIGEVIGEFTKQYPTRRFDCFDDEDGNRVIPVDGTWDVKPRYACLVIDRSNEKLFFRIRKPTPGVNLEDCIEHRDLFAEGFRDYLTKKGIDYK